MDTTISTQSEILAESLRLVESLLRASVTPQAMQAQALRQARAALREVQIVAGEWFVADAPEAESVCEAIASDCEKRRVPAPAEGELLQCIVERSKVDSEWFRAVVGGEVWLVHGEVCCEHHTNYHVRRRAGR